MSGSAQWTYQQAIAITKSTNSKSLWIGDSNTFTVRGIPTKQYKKLLGQECVSGVYDAQNGVSPSALLALSGTIAVNGVLILCCPEWHMWQFESSTTQQNLVSHGFALSESHFVNRWKQLINSDPSIALYQQSQTHTRPPINERAKKCDTSTLSSTLSSTLPNTFATNDQYSNYLAITDRYPHYNAIITAKRGRGKSVLLGLLAEHYENLGRKVTLCTPLKQNAQTLFTHRRVGKTFDWVAPDSQKLAKPTDLLIIDEAASLPIKETLRIISHCRQFIIATTTDGYEGTGQGFNTKLVPKLNKLYSQLKHVQMNTPIRYCLDDKLEKHLDKVFFMNISKNELIPKIKDFTHLKTRVIRDKSDVSDHYLEQCFGLLTHAHYQTTPEDIVRMLDSPDNIFISLTYGNAVCAIAVIIKEGGNKLNELSADIANGLRRVKGHQMAQKLGLLLSDPSIATDTIWRINRIAVKPIMQNKGLGSYFLKQVESVARQEKIDILGASFGCNEQTANYWIKNDYTPIHLGNTPDKSTGERAVFVYKMLSSKLKLSQKNLTALFYTENVNALNASYSYLHPSSLELDIDQQKYINTVNQKRILDYVNGSRSYLHMGNSISVWINRNEDCIFQLLKTNKPLSESYNLLEKKWVKGLSDRELQMMFKISGRKKLYNDLKKSFTNLYWKLVN